MIYKNLKEAESLLRGHIGFTEVEDHGICAARFTEDQLAFYKQLSEHDYIRSHVLAGISLDFITDASEISFEYEYFLINSASDLLSSPRKMPGIV